VILLEGYWKEGDEYETKDVYLVAEKTEELSGEVTLSIHKRGYLSARFDGELLGAITLTARQRAELKAVL
jgi:hypothetical protein